MPDQHSCPKCGAVFLNEVGWGSHIERRCCDINDQNNTKPNIPFTCQICGHSFESSHQLKCHENKCQIGKADRSRSQQPQNVTTLKIETYDSTTTKRLFCDYCGVAYASKSGLKKHMFQVHLQLAQPITKGKRAKDKSQYQFACSKCGKKMYNERYKLNHEQKCFTHLCSYCGKYFKNHTNLSVHIMSHTKERPFECKLCDKAFLIKRSLQDHMNKHEGVKPYKCPFENCDKMFALNTGVRQHINVMHREKRFTCTLCQKQLSTKFHLDCHIRSHTGEKPYKCTDCSAAFRLPSTFRKHRRVHTGERPYNCDICKKVGCGRISCSVRQHKH